MTVSAHDVAAELRRLLPDAGRKKIHKLLYYCQGHHLAHLGVPLFGEEIAAWDMGPVVPDVWYADRYTDPIPEPKQMSNGELNTVGYVASRYGKLTGRELELMSHGERPWRLTDAQRVPGASAPIDPVLIRDYFVEADAADRAERPVFDSAQRAAMIAEAARRQDEPIGEVLTVAQLRERVAARFGGRG